MKGTPRENVFLIGESPMVEEFTEECLRAGYFVTAKLNHSSRQSSLPRGSAGKARRAALAVELTNTDRERKTKNIRFLEKSLPHNAAILSSSVTITASEQATWLKSPGRLMGLAALPSLLSGQLLEIAPTLSTSRATVSAAKKFLERLGKEIAVVQDRVGMVLPRILCMLINEASFAVMENVAHPRDVDIAMKLGTNYPLGPVEWADRIGIQQVFCVLQSLHQNLGEERYRIAPLLRQMATGKQWWST